MDDSFVVVNDFKTHAFLYKSDYSNVIRLQREDYYAEISKYPIAYFKKDNIPHLVYGTAWNRVDIINLNTKQIITADKSLIEKDAEEVHEKYFKQSSDYLWPSSVDYFYGELHVSHDQNHFLSSGWTWGPQDSPAVFNIEDFINSNRIDYSYMFGYEHLDRKAFFIDNKTIGFLVNSTNDDIDDQLE